MNKQKIWVLSGIQGSGKSTYAKGIVKNNKGTYRVNKDLLRQTMYLEDFNPRHEKVIALANNALCETVLKNGYNLVSDNMNLAERDINFYGGLALTYSADIEIIKMSAPVEECIKRDEERKTRGERYVGRDVILNTAHRHGLIKQEKDIAIFDMDGTLADCSHRVHHVKNIASDPNWKPNWNKFFDGVFEDAVRHNVVTRLFEHIDLDHEIVICSGRPERTRKATEAWLKHWSIPYDRLIMRQDGDNQDDVTLKQGFLDKFMDKSKVVYIADDRPKVVRMWKANGLNVEDFGDGVEF
jgi:predicted kinase